MNRTSILCDMKNVWIALQRSKISASNTENFRPIIPRVRDQSEHARRGDAAITVFLEILLIVIVPDYPIIFIAWRIIGPISNRNTEGKIKTTTGIRIFTGASFASFSAMEKRLERS